MKRCLARHASSAGDRYQYGAFGSFFTSEALPGALPRKQNSPKHPPYGLFPELVSGNAFTEPRTKNRYSWLYRIRPSVQHGQLEGADFEPWVHPTWVSPPFKHVNPAIQLKFKPRERPPAGVDFIDGTVTVGACGDPTAQDGNAANTYIMTASMSANKRYFRSADADTLILPQEGSLEIRTELGDMTVSPWELALIPRGLAFQVNLPQGADIAQGYYLENFGAQFVVPDLGPIGISGGLAHPRHFVTTKAAYEEKTGEFELVTKYCGNLFRSKIPNSPFDVVAWYGNLVPSKYDMRLFMAINSVTYDHPDPSIGTVLSSYTGSPGLANVDFVIFPPRWMAAEGTFRPPWYHRNYMSEFMGLLQGKYDAKPDGFKGGSCSMHNRMLPHGPDSTALEIGTKGSDDPQRYCNNLAFMWETRLPWHPSEYALQALLDTNYPKVWKPIEPRFDPKAVPKEEEYPFPPNRN